MFLADKSSCRMLSLHDVSVVKQLRTSSLGIECFILTLTGQEKTAVVAGIDSGNRRRFGNLLGPSVWLAEPTGGDRRTRFRPCRWSPGRTHAPGRSSPGRREIVMNPLLALFLLTSAGQEREPGAAPDEVRRRGDAAERDRPVDRRHCVRPRGHRRRRTAVRSIFRYADRRPDFSVSRGVASLPPPKGAASATSSRSPSTASSFLPRFCGKRLKAPRSRSAPLHHGGGNRARRAPARPAHRGSLRGGAGHDPAWAVRKSAGAARPARYFTPPLPPSAISPACPATGFRSGRSHP